jgi:hypothetical protein
MVAINAADQRGLYRRIFRSNASLNLQCCGSRKEDAGAAKSSFLKKCEREATEKCEAAAAERKLAGAAKNSNIKKCLKDTVGE